MVDLQILDRAIQVGDFDAIMSEANRFLAEHARDPLAPRFLHARAAVRIQRGDCPGALADLDRLPQVPEVDRLRARCAQR